MITTQRLIMIFIFLSIVSGVVQSIHESDTNVDLTNLDASLGILDEELDQFDDEDRLQSGSVQSNIEVERSARSAQQDTLSIWNIMFNTAIPWAVKPWNQTTEIEALGAWFIMLMKSMMYILIAVEIVMLFKNKKQS